MELSRERSPPAAAQELPGGERYLEIEGFSSFRILFFFLYLAGKVFPFHLLSFLHVASVFFLFVIAFVVIVILVVIEFAVGVLCSGKKTIDQLFL